VPKRTLDWRLEEAERRRKKPSTAKIPNTPEELCKVIQFTPDDWQLQILREVADLSHPSDILANISRQGGKALSLDTPLATPTGWTTMGDVHVGDYIFNECGEPTKVVACSDVMVRPTYRVVFSDKSEIIADGEHLWTTLNAATRDAMQYKLRYIPENWPFWKSSRKLLCANTVTTNEISKTLTRYTEKNHSIPTTGPLITKETELPIPPYVLGAWLGDGHSYSGGFSSIDSEICRRIESCGFEVTHSNVTKESHHIKGLRGLLKNANLLNNKHIPPIYLRASIEQRRELVRGLMDTDGTAADGYNYCTFCNTNQKIIEGTLELLRSLGEITILYNRPSKLYTKLTGKTAYSINFSACSNPFNLTRKAERVNTTPFFRRKLRYIMNVEPTGRAEPVRCIAVDSPSGLYLAGRSMIPTHNTQVAAIASVYHAITHRNAKVVIISRSQRQSSNLFNLIRQVYRAAGEPVKPVSETALQLYLENNSYIVALPSSEETIRGYTATLLWVDEASRVPDSLINAVKPFTATVPNAKVCMMSTPAGSRGYWFREVTKGKDYIKITKTANEIPRIKPSFLRKERDRMGERMFAQEYLCSFEANEDSVFRPEVIRKAFTEYDSLDEILDGVFSEDREDELEFDALGIDDIELESMPDPSDVTQEPTGDSPGLIKMLQKIHGDAETAETAERAEKKESEEDT
jgi:hypothetical protein